MNQQNIEFFFALGMERAKNIESSDCVTTILAVGEAGGGKSYWGDMIAKYFAKGNQIFLQCNNGTQIDDLVFGISVSGVVQKVTNQDSIVAQRIKILYENKIDSLLNSMADVDALIQLENEYKERLKPFVSKQDITISKGVLIKAIEESQKGKVVLILDELDKAPRDVDAFLLDYLQNFRIEHPQYGTFQGIKSNIIVIITSNDERRFIDALYRRVDMIEVPYPDDATCLKRLQKNIKNLNVDVAKKVIKHISKIRNIPDINYKPTFSELQNVMRVWHVLEKRDNINEAITNIISKDVDDRILLNKKFKFTDI